MISVLPGPGGDDLREPGADADQRRTSGPPDPVAAQRGPSLRRRDVYPYPVVDGRERREGATRAILSGLRGLFKSERAIEEARLEARLAAPAEVTRTNIIAVISPKGGVGKTTVTFLVGNLLASRLKVRAIAVDGNPDFGTLAAFAPDAVRSDNSLAELLAAMPRLTCVAELWPFVSRLPTGLHLLAAPASAELMGGITPEQYGELLAFLGQYYEIVLLDLGTGITDPLAQFAVQRADQVTIVTTPEWITATTVSRALRHLDLTRATLVLNHAPSSHAGDARAIARHFADHRLARRIMIPYDEQLRMMLDSGTFTLDALHRTTRLSVKELGVEIAGGLV